MAINEVIFGNEVLIDLKSDTVTADKLLSGITAHGADGEPIVGTLTATDVQLANGTFRLSRGNATVSLDFVPDCFTVTRGEVYEGSVIAAAADFRQGDQIDMVIWSQSANDGAPIELILTRNGATVKVKGIQYDGGWGTSNASGIYSYYASRFTA